MAKISSGNRWIWVMNTYSDNAGCAECCELCGERHSGSRQSAGLCPACSKTLEAMPVTVKNSMERFLIGNVC